MILIYIIFWDRRDKDINYISGFFLLLEFHATHILLGFGISRKLSGLVSLGRFEELSLSSLCDGDRLDEYPTCCPWVA